MAKRSKTKSSAPKKKRSAPPSHSLWVAWINEPRFPALDRWMARAVTDKIPRSNTARQGASTALFQAARHAVLALFIVTRDENPDEPIAVTLRRFSAQYCNADAIRGGLRPIPPRLMFRLVRKIAAGAHPILKELAELPGSIPALLRVSIPAHFAAAFEARVAISGWNQAQIDVFLEGQNSRPPLWMRARSPEERAKAVELLEADGYTVTDGPEGQEEALQVEGPMSIYTSAVRTGGLAEVQDIGSQAIGAVVEAKPGDRGWDVCAGAGGKTLQLASAMAGKGVLLATDIFEKKLRALELRARRADQSDLVRRELWDGETLPVMPRGLAGRGGFDWVFIDAPCTSAGTWRRNPEAKWRADLSRVESLNRVQSRLLTTAAPKVRPGGVLVYATCSWLPEENEKIVEAFESRHWEFEREVMELRGFPLTDGDTYFVARWRRKTE